MGGELIEAHLEQVYFDSLRMFGLSAAKLTLTSPHLSHSSLLSFSFSSLLPNAVSSSPISLWVAHFGLPVIALYLAGTLGCRK